MAAAESRFVLNLRNLRRPPDSLPPDTVTPPTLDFGIRPLAWLGKRRKIRRRWLDFLGPFPARCALNLETLAEETLATHVRRTVRYRVEDLLGGIWVEAYLLIPRGATGRMPAIVLFHPTSHHSLREPVGLAGPPSLHNALHLVERGYVVLCPRNFLWDYRGLRFPEGGDWRADLRRTMAVFFRDHPGWTGMGKMVWDGIRAVDCLEALAFVDADRIGCFGFSLGGKEALYLPAFDGRVKGAVSVDGGIGLTYSNWHDPWYLGERIRQPGFGMDNHEVLSLIAPRAFLLIGSVGGVDEETGKPSGGADGERSWPYLAGMFRLWRLHNARERLGILCHAHGHSLPRIARETAYAWLDRWLADAV